MKQQLEVLGRLAQLRGSQVRQLLGRITYQRGLCQRYRANIDGLGQLCGFRAPADTALQRANQQQYKATLYRMLQLQLRELEVAEGMLERIQEELRAAMRGEKIVQQLLDGKLRQWQAQLARQEQNIQDGLAAQRWWRERPQPPA